MDTVVVFTWKDTDSMTAEGGCGYWKADIRRLRDCSYLVATANANAEDTNFTAQQHGQAFLVGKVAGTFRSPKYPDRVVITISEYAEVDIPDVWPGNQNPVYYTSFEALDIDPDKLHWQPFPAVEQQPQPAEDGGLTVEEAKRGLAKKFGVTPEQIEIVIRG